MVVICLPTAADTGSTQLRVAAPSTCTVQAPHRAMPQPNFVPVSPSASRSTHSSGVSSATSAENCLPLTSSVIIGGGLQVQRRCGERALSYNRHSMNESDTDETALLAQALAWRESGLRVGIATVVSTWGSAPRPAGSLRVCNESGQFAGSVSGGCVEVAVIEAAAEVMRDGAPRRLEFGVADELAFSVGLACGGRIRVWVEALE